MKYLTLGSSRKFALAAVAAASLASVAQFAQAADGLDGRTALTVHYSDLNMNTDAGVATLYNRIRHAAQQVCGDVDPRRLDEAAAAQTCVNHAIATSVAAVGNKQLDREFMARVHATPKLIYVASTR
jgi:UrcA family protein